MTSKDAEETCSGYLRKPHNAPPVVYLVYPDGKKQGLCRICANRWLLSEEEFPPKKAQPEGRSPRLANHKIPT